MGIAAVAVPDVDMLSPSAVIGIASAPGLDFDYTWRRRQDTLAKTSCQIDGILIVVKPVMTEVMVLVTGTLRAAISIRVRRIAVARAIRLRDPVRLGRVER